MQNEVRNYLLLALLICVTAVGGYAAYSSINKFMNPNSDDISISGILDLNKYSDDEKLAEYNPPVQKTLDVLHYDINIDLLPKSELINGDVTLAVKLNDPALDVIPLNFHDNLQIKDVEVNGVRVKFEQDDEHVKIYKSSKLDSAKIRIVYSGSPKSLGFGSFNFSKQDGSPFVYTMNEPVFASTWLPCVDSPDDKALVDISITNDSNCVSLSNGKLVSVTTKGDKKTYHWKTFYPISTYLIAIYSGRYKAYTEKYVSVSHDTINIDYYAFNSDYDKARRDFEDHPNYIKVFEELFGPYPFPKEKYAVAEFLWQSGAMEHQTITGIGSNFVTGRKFFSDMLIHELSHHWWGNAVSPKTWKDVWLNEGFATYSEALYWEKEAGFKALQSTLRNKKNSFDSGKLYNPGNSLFSTLVYNKGAWVLHMLRKEVGDQYFFAILKKYFETYKYSNASTADFKSLCEMISKKNLTKFFDEWVYKGEGIINLEYTWKKDVQNESSKLVLDLEQVQKSYNAYSFPLDVKIMYEDGSSYFQTINVNSRKQTLQIQVKLNPVNVILDPDQWLLANISKRND